jgi:CHAT domain-containing protein/tetratricopeptide (TPR) repeat protein
MSQAVTSLLHKNEEDIRRYAAELGQSGLARLLSDLDQTIQQLNLHAGQARTAASAEAVRLARLTLSMVVDSGEPALKAEAHRLTAYVLNANEQYDEAIPHYIEAIALLEQHNAAERAARMRLGYIAALFMTGQYQHAIEVAKHADEWFVRNHDEDGHARLCANLGNVYHRLDEHARSLEYHTRALTSFRKLHNAPAQARCHLNLANSLSVLDRFDEADRAYLRSQRMSEKLGLTDLFIQAKYNRAYLSFLRGRYSEAIQTFAELREHFNHQGSRRHSALCDLDESEIYLHLNLTRDALTLAQRAADSFKELGNKYEQAKATAFVGIALTDNQLFSKALDVFRESQTIFEQENNLYWAAATELYRAQVYFLIERFWEARSLSRSAYERFTELHNPSKRAMALVLLTRIAVELGNAEAAAEHSEMIQRLIRDMPIPLHLFPCHLINGQVAEMLGDIAQAQLFYTRAADEIEVHRAHLHHDDMRVTFSSGKQQVYESLVRLALPEGEHRSEQVVDAYNWCERAKSRGLVDLLSQHLPGHANADRSLLDRIKHLHEELNSYYIRSAPRENAGAPRAADFEIKRDELAKSLKELSDQDPEYVSLQKVSIVSVEEVQKVLPADSTLVEFFITRDEILAFLISRDNAVVRRHLCTLSRVQHLQERLRLQMDKFLIGADYVRAYAPQLQESTLKHLHELYLELVQPYVSEIKTKHIIVVPHGPLHYFPFHAFFDGEQYLIDRFTVSYAPSASVLRYCRQREPVQNPKPLIIGVPDKNAPLIAHEIRRLRELVPQAQSYVGRRATRSAFRREAAEADFIHVATHAVFRNDSPMFSSFKLADGPITALDLYSMQCRTNLVTLSGCKSGISEIAGADELLGLMRGFLYAGARSLLLSLWDVNDRSTSRFMGWFYQNWLAGASKSEALRAAIQKLRIEEPHPYFWAPFVLVGNP